MTDKNARIEELLQKLNLLLQKQDAFSKEIETLRLEIYQLKKNTTSDDLAKEKVTEEQISPENEAKPIQRVEVSAAKQPLRKAPVEVRKPSRTKLEIEKFIGENLINKIGIGITIIGVAIGAKYSIDHDLISPLARIILGYLIGIGLLSFGMKLKKNYENFSAVLVSGAMAIMYFLTYLAYTMYGLIPQFMTFTLMLIFTVFTVFAAIKYNKQIIAHIGLVGAYAVPFLLSDGSGAYSMFFSYITIINIGILVLSLQKYWKPLYYVSFVLTWMIFFSWTTISFKMENFSIAFIFLTLFFLLFYATFLAYKLYRKEKFDKGDIILLLANSFIFFGIGYGLLIDHETGRYLLGVFTISNAILHFFVSVLIYRKKLADKHLFYLVSGLVLVFITIAIPVQLSGNWITLLWVGEAALLYWIGRTKNIAFYEKLSFPLMLLAFGSLLSDWETMYGNYTPENSDSRLLPIFNVSFLTSILFVGTFGFINVLNQNKKYTSILTNSKGFLKIMSFLIPSIFLFTLYYAFHLEIENYWDQLYADSFLSIMKGEEEFYYWNDNLTQFKFIWIMNYSLLFGAILWWINKQKIKNIQLENISIIISLIAILSFLTGGLYNLSVLRETYLDQTLAVYYPRGMFYLGIRYVSYLFIALSLFVCFKFVCQEGRDSKLRIIFDFVLSTSVLWIASSELINGMDIAHSTQSYKLGLSILWGSYSLLLIILGIWKKKTHLRIGAIVLFGITLIKLFFYDIASLNTIAKTVVFVSLGILLLIISFLYNKYKHLISDENKN